MKDSRIEAAIVKTLLYFELFGFPLTLDELHRFLFTREQVSIHQIEQAVLTSQHLRLVENFVVRKNQESLIKIRKIRSKWSEAKFREINRLKTILRYTPFVYASFITGSQATQNAKHPEDDIDVLVITKPRRLWLTRLLIIIITSLLGKYRHHNQHTRRGWCFNLWLEANDLKMSPSRQNRYTALEIVLARPLSGKTQSLVTTNQWLTKYLANFPINSQDVVLDFPANWLLDKLNMICYSLETWYMKGRMTREQVELNKAFFHPRDTKNLIIRAYNRKLKSHLKLAHGK